MAADGRRIVPDKVIAQTFVRELKRDTLLAREPIQVKVDVGVVTLAGSGFGGGGEGFFRIALTVGTPRLVEAAERLGKVLAAV